MPWHPETAGILREYLGMRDAEIARAHQKNPGAAIPEALLIYERGGQLHSYKKSAIEKILNGLGARVGFHLSNHDLRRTCGRMMYRSGVSIEIIARIFRHSDTRTTKHYLGFDYEDMSNAMSIYAQYQKEAMFQNSEQSTLSQMESGQGGI